MKKKFVKFIASWLSVSGLQLLLLLFKVLPRGMVYPLGRMMSRIYYIGAYKNRSLALSNLAMALGDTMSEEKLKCIARESFQTMGQIILDTVYYKDLSPEKMMALVKIDGVEHLQKALERGKGVIAASAHLGSFTVLGARLGFEGYKCTFVARHARNKKIEQIIMGFCRQTGQKVIFSRPILACMRLCIKVLSRNEILVIELDQNFGTEGLDVIFFGRKAMVATGPIKLSMNTGAAVLPMFIIRNPDGTHVIKIHPQVEFSFKGDTEKDIRGNLQNIVDTIEKCIRAYPGQWVNWIHKRWETGRQQMPQ
ncbi:MAG: hypothetical protein KKH34_01260 [Candidatus Omnitrophica bacterium]|nr:hypothetical protein [Candidatus Omnitrophota bacterium]MCG2702817.1 hypothetical protein [Candidatus Omnitrophota bacterium]